MFLAEREADRVIKVVSDEAAGAIKAEAEALAAEERERVAAADVEKLLGRSWGSTWKLAAGAFIFRSPVALFLLLVPIGCWALLFE